MSTCFKKIRTSRGSSTVEYLILFGAIASVLIIFMRPSGTLVTAVTTSYNGTAQSMSGIAARLAASRDPNGGSFAATGAGGNGAGAGRGRPIPGALDPTQLDGGFGQGTPQGTPTGTGTQVDPSLGVPSGDPNGTPTTNPPPTTTDVPTIDPADLRPGP